MRRNLFHYDVLDSTMKEYERLCGIEISSAKIVRADRQSQGLGRGANQWDSSLGGLWFTFDLFYPELVDSFALYVGVCLHRSLLSLFDGMKPHLRIKWPNDLFYDDRKLAGILCKHSVETGYVIGIGINTNNTIENPDLVQNTASLTQIIGSPVSNNELMHIFMLSIVENLSQIKNPSLYLDYCNDNLYGMGRYATVNMFENKSRGIIRGLDNSGAVLLETSDGQIKAFNAGGLAVDPSIKQ
ncbi:MAG TPA: biotin--[acetyl-CoA-carboxylase] ligase [Candidatus Cloacimonadota bacterium]|nr:biotin--[acetyl-CoA-carboxylase] ligase [Candidatus Cloacimonadota bacterium]